MHELAIAQSIVEAVEAKAVEYRATRVKSVRLKIGEANGIVPDSLHFCFEMLVSPDPLLEQAQLVIDITPHLAHCRNCKRDFTVINYVAQCPDCQEWSREVISGTEFQVLDMEIETASDAC